MSKPNFVTKVCPVCGGQVRSRRAVYCSAACKQKKFRAVQKLGGHAALVHLAVSGGMGKLTPVTPDDARATGSSVAVATQDLAALFDELHQLRSDLHQLRSDLHKVLAGAGD
jgi:hypothetical protein